jgi:hypothetical protein
MITLTIFRDTSPRSGTLHHGTLLLCIVFLKQTLKLTLADLTTFYIFHRYLHCVMYSCLFCVYQRLEK